MRVDVSCHTIHCWQNHPSTPHIANAQQHLLLFDELQYGFVHSLDHAEGAVETHRADGKHLRGTETRARSEGIYTNEWVERSRQREVTCTSWDKYMDPSSALVRHKTVATGRGMHIRCRAISRARSSSLTPTRFK